MSRFALAILCLIATLTLSACDAEEKAMNICISRMQENMAQDVSLYGKSFSPPAYCECLIHAAKGGTIAHNDPATARDCMIKGAQAEFIRHCETEIAPQIQSGLDCNCFLTFTVDENIRMDSEGKTTLSDDERNELGRRAMEKCST